MPDSAAERARRARRHRKGDHSLCDPSRRCEALEAAELRDAVASSGPRVEAVSGSRGAELREALADTALGPLQRVLVEEAARIVDRLDRLDVALSSKGEWLRFERDDGGDVVVTIDNVLSETRQQAVALKALVAEIRAALPKPKVEPERPAAAEGGALGDLLQLAARRRAPAG